MTDAPEAITADVVIVGGGCAGLTAALAVDERLQVALFCKRPLGNAASAWAQGGIAAVSDAADSFDAHIEDTLKAGAGLCDAAAVAQVVEDAPAAIDWLQQQGVVFNSADGKHQLALEGGHRHRRIIHSDDKTGWAVVSALREQVRRRRNVRLYENHIAVDLSVRENTCAGVYILDIAAGGVAAVSAPTVILSTGGAGRVYVYSTTPADSSGDGIAMAYRAGCAVANMEFFQFHPTCLYHPEQPTLLISEAVRGEGARLVNNSGQSFVRHPAGDLAPRDIVARAIDKEIKRTGSDCVFLDCRAHPAAVWQRRFPSIINECRRRGFEVPQDLLPVVPAAHYTGGGVVTNLHGQTPVTGLYAIGETAHTGLHGANRLASNSLLECVVMGQRCAAAVSVRREKSAGGAVAAWDERRILPPKETVMIAHNWEELRRTMSNYVGISRSDERLQRARRRVEWIRDEIEEHYRRYIVDRDFLELRNLTQCAQLIIEGALARRESRGLHYNSDCPDTAAVAVPTVLTRADFAAREQAINPRCPFSQRLVVAGAITHYRGVAVGFCNPHCRDTFAQAAKQNFAAATQEISAAKLFFDRLIDSPHPAR